MAALLGHEAERHRWGLEAKMQTGMGSVEGWGSSNLELRHLMEFTET